MKRLLFVVLLCVSLSILFVSIAVSQENKVSIEPIILTGIVYDEFTNEPIPNLRINAGVETITTDSKGMFKLSVETKKTNVFIIPFGNDIVSKSVDINVNEFKDKVIKIVAEHGIKLKVKVQDPHGNPIKNAMATYMPGGGDVGGTNQGMRNTYISSFRTDDNGIAVVGMLSRIRNSFLIVEAPGYDQWVESEIYAPLYAKDGITITLQPKPKKSTTKNPAFLTGIIYDESGKPVPNLKVYSSSSGHEVTETDSKGMFKYPVNPDENEIQILPFSNEIVGRSVFVNVDEFKDKIVEIVVEHGMKLNVTVQDEQGKPIKGAQATYMPGGGGVGTSDDKGVAVVGMASRLREGRLTVRAPGYKPWTKSNIYATFYADGITVIMTPGNSDEPVSCGL